MKTPVYATALLLMVLFCAACSSAAATRPTKTPVVQDDFLVRQLIEEDAQNVATVLNATLDVQARALTKTNCVVVVGKTETVKLADGVINMLDRASGPEDIILFIYPLKHAPANEIAVTMQKVFDNEYAASPDRFARIKYFIIPDAGSNSVLIHAQEADADGIRKTLDELDVPASGAAPVHPQWSPK